MQNTLSIDAALFAAMHQSGQFYFQVTPTQTTHSVIKNTKSETLQLEYGLWKN